MDTAPSRVHLIVAADYGERIRDLPRDEPAWVADTPVNAPVIRAVWKERPTTEHRTGITSFRVAIDSTPEDWLLGIIDAIDLHHGEYSQASTYLALHVVGAPLSPRLRAELRPFGFEQYEDTLDRFVARRQALAT